MIEGSMIFVKNPKGREEDTVLQDLAFLQDLTNLGSF